MRLTNILLNMFYVYLYMCVIQFKAKMGLSQTRQATLKEEMENCCNLDTPNPTVRFPVDAVYDTASFELSWKDVRNH